MEKIKKSYKIFQEKYAIIVNKYIIYFLILSMSLFLSTDYFPIIEYILVAIAIYMLAFLSYRNFRPLISFLKSNFFIWYVAFWSFLVIMTCFRNQIELVTIIKNGIVFSAYIFGFGVLYTDEETKKYIKLTEMIEIVAVFLSIWILVCEFPLLMQGERIGFSVMGGNPNNAGTFLSIYLFFIIYNLTQANGNKKKIIKHFLAFILCFTVILTTGSKKAIIASIMAFVLFIFKENHIAMKRVIIFSVAGIVAIVACCTVPILYNNIGRRFLSLFGELGIINFQTDHSSDLRMTYTEDAIKLWKKTPVLGGGYNNFMTNSGYKTYSHNNYTEVLCTVGIVGALFYYGYYIILLKKNIWLKDKRNMLSIMYSLYILSVFISDIGAVTFSIYPIYYIMVFLIEDNIKQRRQYNIENGEQTNS